jgi:glycosyltransferase involved in cell wall biosynthesis
MLKLGYFTHSNISPSETFIYDLVKGLSEFEEIDLTYVSGKMAPLKTDLKIKSISTGFAEKRIIWSYRAYKLGQVFGNKGSEFKMYIQKRNALRCLNNANLPVFDMAFVDYATSGVLVNEYLLKNNIPFVVNVNGYDASSALSDLAYSKEIKILFEKAYRFISPSHHLKRRLILEGCNPDKIVVLPYGIGANSIHPIPWVEKLKNPPSVIFIGRLTHKKNPIALLFAFDIVRKKIPECQFTIIGDGELRKEVEDTLDRLLLRNSLKMLGVLPRSKSFPILNSHWIYAQHSVTSNNGDQEGFPVSLAEAAMHSLPLVSTIHSGITDNIIDGKTGFLVQEYDYESMAEKIIYLIQNPDIAEQMGKAGREHIMQLCEPGKRVAKITALLKEASKK